MHIFSAGSGLPVNSCVPLYGGGGNPPDLYEDTGGGVWLRTGVIESDASKYPDANTIAYGPTGTVININTLMKSATFDGTNFWFLKANNGAVELLKYSLAGERLLVVDISDNATIASTRALTFDGEHLVASRARRGGKGKWNKNTGAFVIGNIHGLRDLVDLCWDGHYHRELGPDGRVHKYDNRNGSIVEYDELPATYRGQRLAVTCLAWDGSHFWAGEWSTGSVYRLDHAMQPTGATFTTRAYVNVLSSLVWAEGTLWAGDITGKLHQLQLGGVGEPLALVNNKTGYSYYVKVK